MKNGLSLVQVGQTNLAVTRMGLGTAHIGNGSTAQGVEIIHKALELGVNFLDTAPLYHTESILGEALAGVPRGSYVLATKIGRLPDGSGGFHFDFSRSGVIQSIENSLNALKQDRIDILHIHDPDNHYKQALDEAYPALTDLRAQGVIHAVGSGMNQWQMLSDFARSAAFDCFLLAGRYTLLEQTSLNALASFREKHISLFTGGVFNSGILATGATTDATYNYRIAPPEIMQRARRLEALCTRHGVPLNAAAVQFVSAHPAVTSLVLGADEIGQVEANLKAFDVPIPAAFWADLRAEGLIEPGAPTPGETQ